MEVQQWALRLHCRATGHALVVMGAVQDLFQREIVGAALLPHQLKPRLAAPMARWRKKLPRGSFATDARTC